MRMIVYLEREDDLCAVPLDNIAGIAAAGPGMTRVTFKAGVATTRVELPVSTLAYLMAMDALTIIGDDAAKAAYEKKVKA